MRHLFTITLLTFVAIALSGCLASATSPDGVNCDYSQGKPLWEMPLVCQGK